MGPNAGQQLLTWCVHLGGDTCTGCLQPGTASAPCRHHVSVWPQQRIMPARSDPRLQHSLGLAPSCAGCCSLHQHTHAAAHSACQLQSNPKSWAPQLEPSCSTNSPSLDDGACALLQHCAQGLQARGSASSLQNSFQHSCWSLHPAARCCLLGCACAGRVHQHHVGRVCADMVLNLPAFAQHLQSDARLSCGPEACTQPLLLKGCRCNTMLPPAAVAPPAAAAGLSDHPTSSRGASPCIEAEVEVSQRPSTPQHINTCCV